MRYSDARSVSLVVGSKIQFQFRNFSQRWLFHRHWLLRFGRLLVKFLCGIRDLSGLLARIDAPLRKLNARGLLAPPVEDLTIPRAEQNKTLTAFVLFLYLIHALQELRDEFAT